MKLKTLLLSTILIVGIFVPFVSAQQMILTNDQLILTQNKFVISGQIKSVNENSFYIGDNLIFVNSDNNLNLIENDQIKAGDVIIVTGNVKNGIFIANTIKKS